MVMNRRVNHFRTDLHAQLADHKDSEAVPEERQGHNRSSEDTTPQRGTQKNVATDEACNKERKSGTHAAALGRNLQGDPRQLENQVVSQIRQARDKKQQVCNLRRLSLEKNFDAV